MHTKHVEEHHVFNILMKFNIFTKFTEDKDYAERRRILASAFYKNNVAKMINLIKSVTRKLVEESNPLSTCERAILLKRSVYKLLPQVWTRQEIYRLRTQGQKDVRAKGVQRLLPESLPPEQTAIR